MSNLTVVVARTRADRRAARWSHRFGLPLTPLLVRRLAIRTRAGWLAAPVALVSLVVAIGYFVVVVNRVLDDREPGVLSAVLAVSVGVPITAAAVVSGELVRRAEAGLRAKTAGLVGRRTRVPVVTVLGRVQTVVGLIGLPGVAITWTVLALQFPATTAAWCVAAAAAVVSVLVAVGLWRVVSRPEVAVDGPSLTVDDELRTGDARALTSPLPVLMTVQLSSVMLVAVPSPTMLVATLGTMLALLVLQVAHSVGLLRGAARRRPR